MSKLGTISEVSEALGIAASTIRYWDKIGLIRFTRNEWNNYRHFSAKSLFDICNIMLLRNLDLPLEKVKTFSDMDAVGLKLMFNDKKSDLKRKIETLTAVIARIEIMEKNIKTFENLRHKPLRIIKAKLSAIRLFSFSDKEMVRLYLNRPDLSADLLKGGRPESENYGMFVQGDEKNIIRPADSQKRPYLHGLLRLDYNGRTNADAFLKEAEKMKLKSGDIISRYLISTRESGHEYCDYHEAWLEV